MKFCENCGAQLDDNATFCDECGTDQNQPVEVEDSKPKKRSKKVLFIVIIAVAILALLGGGVYWKKTQTPKKKADTTVETKEKEKSKNVEEEPKSIREAIKWQDNSEKVEAFKKLFIAPYPDSPIGKALSGDYSVISWKYGQKDKEEYWLCNYTYEEKDNILIFYKDSFDNINVAEYYIKNELQDKSKTNDAIKEIFSVEVVADDKDSEKEIDSTSEETEKPQSPQPTVSIPSVYPEGGIYGNYNQGGMPYSTDIEILPRDDTSFSYKITRRTGETGNEKLEELLLSGIMTHDINLGADSTNKVYFSDPESGAYIVYYDNGYVDNGYGTNVHDITVALGGADSITATTGEQFYKYWIY